MLFVWFETRLECRPMPLETDDFYRSNAEPASACKNLATVRVIALGGGIAIRCEHDSSSNTIAIHGERDRGVCIYIIV